MSGARRCLPRGMTLVELLVTMAIIGCLIGLLLPAIASVRESARRGTCGSNVRQVALAVLQHESSHRRLPMNDGLAWTQRIAMLTGEGPADSTVLAVASDDERERLLHLQPSTYTCPSARTKTVAEYPGVHIGHNPMLLGARLAEITDGMTKTMLVGELQPALGAPWVLGPTAGVEHSGSDHWVGHHLAFADGSVTLFTTDTQTERLGFLLTPAGGEQ